MSITVVVALLVLSAGCVARRREAALRVHAGQLDSRNEFPFIVVFQSRRAPYMRGCSGSLIAANWVLSAGHCVGGDPHDGIIRYGDFTLPPNETKLYTNMIKYFHHPSRSTFSKENPEESFAIGPRDDVALVLVEKILNKPTARLLALDFKTLFGLPVKYAGFGVTMKELEFRLPVLIPILSDLQFPPRVGEGIIGPCTGLDNIGPIMCVAAKCTNKKEMARPGDSGGPLIYDGRIIGVVKAGNFHNAAYTPVSIYLQWIQAVIRLNA